MLKKENRMDQRTEPFIREFQSAQRYLQAKTFRILYP